MATKDITEQTKNLTIKRYEGAWGKEQVLHLLRRSLFGVTKNDFDFFKKLSLDECLDVLLTDEKELEPPINAYNDASYTDPYVPFGETWVNCPDYDSTSTERRLKSLYAWWVGIMLNQKNSLGQKMTLFWHNHIVCELHYTFDARPAYAYLAVLLKHALGNAQEMMYDITVCPGMLQYLSGNESTAEAPNENFSREMQELFTIGKGRDSHYTQEDVRAAARVLTGWMTTPNGLHTIYNAAIHDTGDKQFSAFYDNAVIKGRSGKESADETRELIALIFKNHEASRHTCRALYRWFVNDKIDTEVEKNIIWPLADLMVANNYEIKPILRCLLSSEHFYNAANIGSQIKNPVDYLIGTCRQFNYTGSSKNHSEKYENWYKISEFLADQAMRPGGPPNVAGWPAYYISPAYSRLWINSYTLIQRNKSIEHFVTAIDGADIKFDLLQFCSALAAPSQAGALIQEVNELLSPIKFDDTQIELLKSFLEGENMDNNSGWSKTWSAYEHNPNNEAAKNELNKRLSLFFDAALKSAQCHLI